jgi:malate dehydrogenase (oxaloacetate-decarboxylating)(NADP+)
VRDDMIMATGRSDYPNQVNNVLGFPFIFRGALDVRASRINEDMQIAAVHALKDLTHEPVPQSVLDAYGLERSTSGPTTSCRSPSIRAWRGDPPRGGARRDRQWRRARTDWPEHYPERRPDTPSPPL